MNKKIMILGASILQLPAIQKAKEMGLEVVAVDMNPNAIGFSEPGIIKEVISTVDIPAVVECAKKYSIDGVMTLASDMPIRTVAAVAKVLGLIGVSEETALKATNKAVMREALQKGNVPIPKFFKVTNEKEYREAVSNFAAPFIVKPADNSGSRGIYLVSNIEDAESISVAYSYSHSFSRNGDLVVEEYLIGPEVSVETLTVNGECNVIQITDKITTGAPHFVEMGHTQPSQLPENTKQKVAQLAKLANRAIGIINGPSHTEIIVTNEGPKIVELGARLGGDCITTHLVPLSTGVDMVECCIKIALGETPDISPTLNKVSAIRYFTQNRGTIKKVNGIEKVKQLNGVKQISMVHAIGETVEEINSSSDRIGFVVMQSDSIENIEALYNDVIDKINIEMER